MAGNMYVACCFCTFKAFKGATKLHESGHFAKIFEKWGMARTPCAPPVPTSMFVGKLKLPVPPAFDLSLIRNLAQGLVLNVS